MGLPPLSPSSWYTVLLGLALELGCWGVALLFGAYWTQQRWRERVWALLSVAAFVWVLLLARSVQAQATYWTSYFTFQATYYPRETYSELYAQTQEEYGLAATNINRLGWVAVGVTEGMVLVGGALLIRWYRPARRHASRKRETLTQAVDDANDLEITIEPIHRVQRD